MDTNYSVDYPSMEELNVISGRFKDDITDDNLVTFSKIIGDALQLSWPVLIMSTSDLGSNPGNKYHYGPKKMLQVIGGYNG